MKWDLKEIHGHPAVREDILPLYITEEKTQIQFELYNSWDRLVDGFLFILTVLGSDPLHSESYRDSSLSQLGPHKTNLAPPSWNSLAHSGKKWQKLLDNKPAEESEDNDIRRIHNITLVERMDDIGNHVIKFSLSLVKHDKVVICSFLSELNACKVFWWPNHKN